jgi:hypothetical protein
MIVGKRIIPLGSAFLDNPPNNPQDKLLRDEIAHPCQQ